MYKNEVARGRKAVKCRPFSFAPGRQVQAIFISAWPSSASQFAIFISASAWP
jgi:hypothetical protein